jgi:dolichyl-phosphate-mannose--protein O-mannosyl transferase
VTLPSSSSYEELRIVASPDGASSPLTTGLPAAWWPSVGSAMSLVFSIFWMMQTWEEAGPLRGPTKVNHLTQGLAGLLAALLCSYGIYRFDRKHSASFSGWPRLRQP